MSTRSLPLTEHRWRHCAIDAPREGEIGRLVGAFYERARSDELLGPIFEAHVRDWDAHFKRMEDFWGSAIYRTGRYSGRPFEVHRDLGSLTAAHMRRWMELWTATVGEVVESEIGPDLIEFAQRMANSMVMRLGLDGEEERHA